jgi:uncharacterized protein YidB (DUF937 family)
MARNMPSLVALLGLLAVAGYQNRDKLGGMLDGLRNSNDPANPNANSGGGFGDILGNLGGALGGLAGGSGRDILNGGLGDLVERFQQSGRRDKVDSWISSGENLSVDTSELEAALGDDTLTELSQKTGLSRADLLERLSQTVPDAVNRLTPDGHLPSGAGA